ncbi:competence protein ComG [Gemella sp. ND 6198]|nr:competence protein ComG [Gemella sp. ND 6198]
MIYIDIKDKMTKIIEYAIKIKASDIHIYPHVSGNSFIKLRIKGELSKYEEYTNGELEGIISLLKFNANIDISKNKEPQSGRFVYEFDGKSYYLRVSTLPLNELTEGCVVRIFINEVEDVDYSIFEPDKDFITGLAKKNYGLILFSGPTGSGKSTSLYKLASEIAKDNRQVITVEGPVEKNIQSLVQMQINDKAGINYDNALKSILRCDPDAIIIGEIRDYKTASEVVTSSFSGHLVASTIHAEDSIGVINRLKDLGLSLEDIRQTVLCIISQRLVTLTTGERGLVTEILKKEDIKDYITYNKINNHTLPYKFNLALEKGFITFEEKEKWGY